MNQIAIKEESIELITKDIENMQKMCVTLLKSRHYQSLGDAGIFAIIQKAKSLGMNVLEALNGGLYYVQGKVGMSSEMMASLIRQQKHSIIKDCKSDNTICILHGKRADNGDTWTVSFSMEDARRAGLAKNMYEKYPGIMLYNRAMSMLARQLFPDVIKGAGYTLDELMEIKSSKDTVHNAERVEVVEEEKPKISKEQAEELSDILKKCPEEYQETVMEFIGKPPINAIGLEQIPLHLYDKIKRSALRKIEETQPNEVEVVVEEMVG